MEKIQNQLQERKVKDEEMKKTKKEITQETSPESGTTLKAITDLKQKMSLLKT